MARTKTNDADFKAYVNEILATIPEEKRAMVEETLTSDAVSERLRSGYLRQADYSRSLDSLREERTRFEAEVNQAKENIAGWENWYKSEAAKTAALQADLEKYAATYGTLEEPAVRTTPGLSREDMARLVDEQVARRSTDIFNSTMSAADMLSGLREEHRDTFGKRLDTAGLLKFCSERQLPLEAGYQAFIADDLNEKREKELQERLAEAREQGAQEARSKYNLPVSAASREPHPLDLMRDLKPTSSFDRVAQAAASFNEAMAGKQ